VLCNLTDKIIDRDKFADALKEAFQEYLGELEQHDWATDIWSKAANKISWLVKMSESSSQAQPFLNLRM
jgi:lipoate-protein ligase A